MQFTAPKPQLNPKRRKNSAFLRLMSIHWWMTRCYAVSLPTGWLLAHWPKALGQPSVLYEIHSSIGVLSVGLLSWRMLVLLQVWWRKYTKRLPKVTPSWLKVFALHLLLYGFMWAVPLTGFFLANSQQADAVRFLSIVLPDLFPQNPALVNLATNLHFWFAYLFLACIVLHILVQWKVLRAHWRQLKHWLQKQSLVQKPD